MPSSLMGLDRAILAQTVTPYKWQLAPGAVKESRPDTKQPVGGDDHDREEDDPDDRVEAPAKQRPSESEAGDMRVRRDVGVHDDEHESAYPRALDPDETPDHGHDEQVARRREVDVAGSDLTAPPGVEHPRHGGEKSAEREGERAVERDVVAERGHPDRFVADAPKRDPERRPYDVADRRVGGDGTAQRDVVEPIRVRLDVPDPPRRVAVDPADSGE